MKGKNLYIQKILTIDYERIYTAKVRIISHLLMWVIFTGLTFFGYHVGYNLSWGASLFLSIRVLLCNLVVFYLFFYVLIPNTLNKGRIILFITGIFLCLQWWLIINYYYFDLLHKFNLDSADRFLRSLLQEKLDRTFWDIASPTQVFSHSIEVINGISPFLFIKITFDLTREYAKKNKTEEKIRELEYENLIVEKNFLQLQLNPHFLFNTLNNLYGLVFKKDKSAPEMILKLSEIMRYTLYEANVERISLEQELTFIDNYFKMEQMRYPKEYLIEKTVIHKGEDNLQIVPLIFFIFMENAFKYGLKSENPYLKVFIQIENKTITFTIENDVSADYKKESNVGGIGLQNVEKRLQLLYPGKHRQIIKSDTVFFSVFLSINLEDE